MSVSKTGICLMIQVKKSYNWYYLQMKQYQGHGIKSCHGTIIMRPELIIVQP